MKDWGFSAGLAFDPQPESQRGLSVTMGQDWGGAATGGIDALFAANPLEQRNGVEGSSRWTLEASYGLPAFAGRFTGAPMWVWRWQRVQGTTRWEWRLTPEVTEQDITFEVKGTRSEKDNASGRSRGGTGHPPHLVTRGRLPPRLPWGSNLSSWGQVMWERLEAIGSLPPERWRTTSARSGWRVTEAPVSLQQAWSNLWWSRSCGSCGGR